MHNKSVKYVLGILAPTIILRPLAMDVLLPCVPAIAIDLNSSAGLTQWILSIYFLAAGAGQLFLGPLADRFGRRPVMLWSIIALLLSSLGCTITHNIYMLIALRFVQGLGACGTTVATMASIRDLFDNQTTPKVYSYFNAIISLAPIFGPLIGGALLIATNNWQASFYLVMACSFIALLMNFYFMKETSPDLAGAKGANTVEIFANYKQLLTDKTYLVYCAAGIVGVSCLFLFYSASALLLINRLGIAPNIYGYYFALYAGIYLLGNIASPKLQALIGNNNTMLYGSLLIVLGGFCVLFTDYYLGLTPLGLVLPNLLVTLGVGLIFGPCTAGAVNEYKHMAGVASACFGTLAYGGSGIIVGLIMQMGEINAQHIGMYIALAGFLNLFMVRAYILVPGLAART